MIVPPKHPTTKRALSLVWAGTAFLVFVGLVAATRRFFVLLSPPPVNPRFAAAAYLDAGFAAHRALTLVHIVPAFFFMALMPFQLVERIRARHIAWHRWSGRLLLLLGTVIGTSALIMSFTMNIGGVSETAATAFFAVLFLLFLSLGFLNIRRHRVDLHRQWMIRAFGIALGVATTRPIVGAFFAARRLSPHEFFGAAFWLGFTTTLVAAEAWIHYAEPRGLPSVATRPHRSAASLRPQRAAGASSDGRASLPSAEDIR
jgi:hypothetical protein